MSSDQQSTGRHTIVVTGASGDIGLAIVKKLIADGFHVAACCRSKPDRISAAFTDDTRVTIPDLDLRDADSIKSCASAIISTAASSPERRASRVIVDGVCGLLRRLTGRWGIGPDRAPLRPTIGRPSLLAVCHA